MLLCPDRLYARMDWDGRIRTCECRYQKPVAYHLPTSHGEAQSLRRGTGAAKYTPGVPDLSIGTRRRGLPAGGAAAAAGR